MWHDISLAARAARSAPNTPPLALSPFALNATTLYDSPTSALQVVHFAPRSPHIPTAYYVTYLASNATMHALNWYWYGKMISAIRKRFDPPFGTRGVAGKRKKLEEKVSVDTRVDGEGRKTVKVDSVEVLRRRAVVTRTESTDSVPPPT